MATTDESDAVCPVRDTLPATGDWRQIAKEEIDVLGRSENPCQ